MLIPYCENPIFGVIMSYVGWVGLGQYSACDRFDMIPRIPR